MHTTDAVCPFCPLLCDDLIIEQRGNDLSVQRNGCARAEAGFSQSRNTVAPQIAGKRASREHAVAAAARLLKRASRPLISGLATDVDGIRKLVALAERSRAIIDHANATGLDLGMRVLQSRGWYLTTLAEIRNRADLVILVGVDLSNAYANFLSKFVAPEQTLHDDRRARRRVVFFGPRTSAPASTTALTVETISTAPQNFVETINALRGLVADRPVAKRAAKSALRALATDLRSAAYPVFVWAPGQLAHAGGDLVVHALARLIDDLNVEGRAAGFSLGGDHGGATAASACAWLTGYPLHVSFAGDTLDYDPLRYSTAKLVADDLIDTLVWVDAFGATPPPDTAPHVRRIVIGNTPPPADATPPDVYLPTGTTGVDHAGTLVRSDSVVSLHCDRVRRASLVSVGQVADAILAAW